MRGFHSLVIVRATFLSLRDLSPFCHCEAPLGAVAISYFDSKWFVIARGCFVAPWQSLFWVSQCTLGTRDCFVRAKSALPRNDNWGGEWSPHTRDCFVASLLAMTRRAPRNDRMGRVRALRNNSRGELWVLMIFANRVRQGEKRKYRKINPNHNFDSSIIKTISNLLHIPEP